MTGYAKEPECKPVRVVFKRTGHEIGWVVHEEDRDARRNHPGYAPGKEPKRD